MDEKKPYSAKPYVKMTPEQLKNFREYQTEYNKRNYRMFTFRLRKEDEREMIEYLQDQPGGASNYIAKLIRQDLKNRAKNK